MKISITAMVSLLLFVLQITSFAQENFKEGDRVLADVNMSSSPENQKWKKATIVQVHMWNGQIAGISIRTDEGAINTVRAEHLKKLPRENQNDDTPTTQRENTATQTAAQFKVGDRVEVDKIMAGDPKDARWAKATVKAVDLENLRYVVKLDENFLDMSIVIRPGKSWIRPLNDGSHAPQQAKCLFNVPPGKVTNTAKPSAELFKRVIYDWQNSIKRGTRLGITFQEFKMGQPVKNILTAKGRLYDFIPTNALVYPIKTKQIICDEYSSGIIRTDIEIEYSCYKNEYNEWVCKNGAPKTLKTTSIYKD